MPPEGLSGFAAVFGISQAAEVEETLKRIQSHRGVEGILIINNDGVALKSTMSAEQTSQYSAEMSRVSHFVFTCINI